MDQKSGKKPVNVNSETEEAENEMKKKTSKTVKSIAAVGFAVGGISAVQNFDAYAGQDGDTAELDIEESNGNNSESNGGSKDDGNKDSGGNEDKESGGHDEAKGDGGNQNHDSHEDGQSGDNSHGDKDNQNNDATNDASNDTPGPLSSNDGITEAANGTNDSVESNYGTEPADNTLNNADTNDSTSEETGPVTTITTETITNDTLSDDGKTTTTTTTVTTTTEKSDGTVTSDTKTSTETKETTYVPADENEPIGPGYIEKYYKSDEDSETADQEISKTDYDKLHATADENNRVKTGTDYFYKDDKGDTVPLNSEDVQNKDEIVIATKYYKPEYDEKQGKVVEKEITADEFAQIKDGNVFIRNEYYKGDQKLTQEEYDQWISEHTKAAEGSSSNEILKDEGSHVTEKKTTTLTEYTVKYTDENGQEQTEKFGTEDEYKKFLQDHDLQLKEDGTSDKYFYVTTKDGTKKHYIDKDKKDPDAKKYTVTVQTGEGTNKEEKTFASYDEFQQYLNENHWQLDENAGKTVRHYYEKEESGKIVPKYLTADEEKAFAEGKLSLGYDAYTEYTITYHVYNSETKKVEEKTVSYKDTDSQEKKDAALSHLTEETETDSKYYYFDKDGEKHVLSKEQYDQYVSEKNGTATNSDDAYKDAYEYSVTYSNDKNQPETVLFKDYAAYDRFVKEHKIKTDGGETVRYYFKTDENGNIVKDKDGNPVKQYLSKEDEKALADGTFKDAKIYTATYVTTDGDKKTTETKTYADYAAFLKDYEGRQNNYQTTTYLDENGNPLELTSDQITAYEKGGLENVVYDVKHTVTYWTWDEAKKEAVKNTVTYLDSDSEENKKQTASEEYYFDENGTRTLVTSADLKNADGELVKTVYTVNGKVVNKAEYDAANANSGKDGTVFYFISNGADENGKEKLIQVDSMSVTVTPEEENGVTKFYVTDIAGTKTELTDQELVATLKSKYKAASGTVTGYYVEGLNENQEKVTISFDTNEKIEEGKTVNGYTLTKDTDGKYYLVGASNERILVSNVSTYTSSATTGIRVMNPSNAQESTAAAADLQNAVVHFLNETAITSNFDIYADSFDAHEHIDGNICVNDFTYCKDELHASGRTDITGLDKYSLILGTKDIYIKLLKDGAKVYGGNGVTAGDKKDMYIKSDLSDGELINVNGSTKEEISKNIVESVRTSYGEDAAARVSQESKIEENLKKIAEAGQSLIEASKNAVASWKDTIKAFLDKNDQGTGQRKFTDGDVLILNVKEDELQGTTSDLNSFTYALNKFMPYVGLNTNARVLLNITPTDEDKVININTSLLHGWGSDHYNNTDPNGSTYNMTAAKLIWNFGNFDGTVNLNNGGDSEGIFVASNGTLKLNGGHADGAMVGKTVYIGAEAHQSHVPHLQITPVEKGFIVPEAKIEKGLSAPVKSYVTDHTETAYTVYHDEESKENLFHQIVKKISSFTKEYKTEDRTFSMEGVSKAIRTLYDDTKLSDPRTAKPIKEESITVSTEDRKTYTASASFDEIRVVSEYGAPRSQQIKKEVEHIDHYITLDKKLFKPLLNKFHDVKVEKIPETPDKPDTPDTPHDDHDTPDSPHDDHDKPDTPKELHDKPDTPEVLGASRPKEQEVLGASRPKVLGVTRAAKTGDVRNMARNGFAAAVGAVVLAVWGTIKSLIGRKRRK